MSSVCVCVCDTFLTRDTFVKVKGAPEVYKKGIYVLFFLIYCTFLGTHLIHVPDMCVHPIMLYCHMTITMVLADLTA